MKRSVKKKSGQIVAIIKAGSRPDAFEFPSLLGMGRARDHESYVIRVGNRHYWPRVSGLTKAEGKQ